METEKQKILLVDDNITNLTTGKNALANHYDVFTTPSAEKMFKILEKITPDMILLDVEMPEMNGYEVIKILKGHRKTASIPVIFLTARNDPESELEGLSLGAIDYVTKPFSPPLLLKRIEVHLLVESQRQQLMTYNNNLQRLVEEKTQTVLELQNAVFDLLAEVVEYRDDVTGGHVGRTQQYVRILLNGLLQNRVYSEEIESWDLRLVILSSLLHDVGKVAIRDSILLKPSRLTAEEFEEMQNHTIFGAKIIGKIEKNTSERKFIKHAKLMAATHHEWWDGTGYPTGLEGTSIPLQGRLMAIVDVYDALVSRRPYKNAMSHEQAIEIIEYGNGSHFDPAIVEVFLKIADEFKNASILPE
ncbi:MAG: response regulator [Planctomycetaceae bacterium]|jgi:putative two-component system response regulator|nr:response regulator [Planctomycetaceae bacterium]